MILSPNDKLYRKVAKGSYLQYSRNASGAAVGCIAGGVTLLVFAVLLALLFIGIGLSGGGVVFAGLFGIPGLLLTLGGVYAKNRRKKNYISFYEKDTGYDAEELRQLEEELKDPSTIVTSYKPKEGNQKGPLIGCIITRNYFLMPMIGYVYARRLRDMVAMAYSERIPGINGYKWGLIFCSTQDQDSYINALMKKEDCMEVINLLSQRNPAVITSQAFMYEGKKYDLLKNREEIIQLYKDLCQK